MKRKSYLLSVLVIGFIFLGSGSFAQTGTAIKNIVLVHGAFVDGSGWKGAYEILVKKGYHVTVVQQPLTSYEEDVAAVNRVLKMQEGPVILVAHSYGGSIITTAGNDPMVKGLVFIAAHAPDTGEDEADNGKKYPPAYKSLVKTSDGFDYIEVSRFHPDFCADLDAKDAERMAHSQMLAADAVFHAVIQTPAWRSKPSWYMIPTLDRIINPELEHFYAKRANSVTVEVEGASHSVYQTHPEKVAALIEEAAMGADKNKR
ncbi:MAG: alpha/beta hydrolase [Chitinophagaceae bacterium]